MNIRKYLFLGIMGILVVLLVAALLGSTYFWYQTWWVRDTLILTHEDGNHYLCRFYRDGGMDCELFSDPDVGGGWESGREAP